MNHSFRGHFDLAFADVINDIVRVFAVDGATDRLARAQNFLDGALETLRHGSVTHLASDGDDCVEIQVAVVLD